MERTKIRFWDDDDYIGYSCNTFMNGLYVVRLDKDYVLWKEHDIWRFMRTLEKIELGEYVEGRGNIDTFNVVHKMSDYADFRKVKCTDPDVGNAFFLGRKGYRYLTHEEMQKTRKVQRKRKTK